MTDHLTPDGNEVFRSLCVQGVGTEQGSTSSLGGFTEAEIACEYLAALEVNLRRGCPELCLPHSCPIPRGPREAPRRVTRTLATSVRLMAVAPGPWSPARSHRSVLPRSECLGGKLSAAPLRRQGLLALLRPSRYDQDSSQRAEGQRLGPRWGHLLWNPVGCLGAASPSGLRFPLRM